MNNCLHTALRDELNDNLPILNTIVLDDFDVASLPNQPRLLFQLGTGSITLTCKVPMYNSSSYTAGVYEKTISNTSRNFVYFKKSEIEGLASIKDFLKISGDGIYNLLKFGNGFFTMNNLAKSGLESMMFNSSLKCFGTQWMTKPVENLPSQIEFIEAAKVYDSWLKSPYAIKVLATGSAENSYELPLNEKTAANNSIQTLQMVKGNIKYLPKNTVYCVIVYNTNGSIEELVASMVARGRTSGSIKININSATNVTYNGTRLGTLYTGNKVLVWENTTITWQDNDTTETTGQPNIYMYDYVV